MAKILYSDATFSVLDSENESIYSKYTKYMDSDGKFVLLLPYHICNNGKVQYLVDHERIYAWDSHADYFGITMPVKYQPEVTAVHIAKTKLGVEIKESQLFHLGTCFASKLSEDSYYILALKVSHLDKLNLEDSLSWKSRDQVIEGVDPILMLAIARLDKIL